MWTTTLAALAVLTLTPDEVVAVADQQTLPYEQKLTTYYLTTNTVPPPLQDLTAAVASFVVCSSSRDTVLDRQMPVGLGGGLYRIDLDGLQWGRDDMRHVLSRYPYSPGADNPLVIRADWLIHELSDAFESDAYYRLLYGSGKIPKTRDEFLKFWKIDRQSGLRYTWTEGNSGVALARKRWIENHPSSSRGYAWGTRDSAVIDRHSDPLEAPTGDFQHDAEEWIIGIPKLSIARQQLATLQVYFLNNAAGGKQDRAPVDIVEDKSRFRGLAEIRTSGSCIQCHSHGILPLTNNELRAFIAGEGEYYADKKTQEQVEREALANLNVEVERNNELFARGVRISSGMTCGEQVVAFKQVHAFYDSDVTLTQAAAELYCEADELRLALAYRSAQGKTDGARLAWLAHGQAMRRTSWEKQYHVALAALKQWRNKK